MPIGKVEDESGHPRHVGYSLVETGNPACTSGGTVLRGSLVKSACHIVFSLLAVPLSRHALAVDRDPSFNASCLLPESVCGFRRRDIAARVCRLDFLKVP